MKIKQIEENEILNSLCENKTVYCFNVESAVSKDLANVAIKTIVKNFKDIRFLYFTVSE